jgi:hypothetical protein
MRRTYRYSIASGLLGFLLLNSAAADTFTFEVTKVVQAGKAKVSIFYGNNAVDVMVDVAAADTPAMVATKIANQIVGGKANGATVTIPKSNGVLFIGPPVNKAIEGGTDKDGFAAAPGQPAGVLTFEPNPITGGTTLTTSSVIRAGFANGLSLVSFTALAGTSIYSLTSMLNSDLDSSGYFTRLLDPTEILVFANGVSTPTELDFSLTQSNPTSDGIGIQLTSVPEPSSALLLTASVAALMAGRARKTIIRFSRRS